MATADVGHIELRELHPEPVGRYWYLLAASGAISGVAGVLVVAYPSPSLKLLGVILGIELVLAGILAMVRGFGGAGATAYLILGVLAIGGGVVVIRNPDKSLVLLVLVFGIYMVIAGALALVRAVADPEGRAIMALRGIVLVTVGTVIVAWPDISLKTLAVLTGIGLVLQGAVEIAEALALRSLNHAAPRA